VVCRLPRGKCHELRNEAAAVVGAFILIVVQRKFWNVEMAATR
jgi:hypothetical protein